MVKLLDKVHPRHKLIQLNKEGRTFVCGDLHGCYDELMKELELVHFDKSKDQLILLGDITDRGIKNYECVKLLSEPWCSSILGNHDEMMLNSVNPRSDKQFWRVNGGGWFDLLSLEKQEEVQFLCERYVEHLPIGITLVLPDGSTVGLLHADAPKDWRKAINGTQQRMEALWGRVRIRSNDRSIVSNVDLVMVGHTSNKNIKQLGNVVYLDTGAGFKNGHLTVIEVGHSIAELRKHIAQRVALNETKHHLDIIFEPLGDYAS